MSQNYGWNPDFSGSFAIDLSGDRNSSYTTLGFFIFYEGCATLAYLISQIYIFIYIEKHFTSQVVLLTWMARYMK